MPVSLDQLLAKPDFHLRLRAGAEPDTPALHEPLAWAHSSDLEDPTPWLSAGGLLLTDGTQFDSRGSMRRRDGVRRRLRRSAGRRGVAALGFATPVVHAEIPERLAAACRQRGLVLIEVAERAPFMAIIAFVNDAAAREQRDRLEWSLAAHRTLARAALRPDGLNAVLRELEGQLGCWVALFDAAGYRVPTATRLPVPAAVEREIGDAVRTALSRGTRGSLRISSAGADVTMQTLGRSWELHGVLAVGAQAALGGTERELVTSVIALASIALDQTRAIEDARRGLRTGPLRTHAVGSLGGGGLDGGQALGPTARPTGPALRPGRGASRSRPAVGARAVLGALSGPAVLRRVPVSRPLHGSGGTDRRGRAR